MTREKKGREYTKGVRIFISADMEGVGGLLDWDQEESLFCRLMTAEVNAAIEGAFEAGATEVVVNDSHNIGRNISIESIDPRATLIGGQGRPMAMMEGIDETFDAAFFIGYHARAGTANAVMNHTWCGYLRELTVNKEPFGEAELNGALAGHFGVPIALLTGDAAVVEQAGRVVSAGETVVSKYGTGMYSAKLLPPSVVTEKIRTAAAGAVLKIDKLRPFTVETPVELNLKFERAIHAEKAAVMPGAVKTEPTAVAYSALDFHTAYRAFVSLIRLAGS